MLTVIKEIMIQKKVKSLLKKYDVVLKHYTPGRVRVSVSNWTDKKDLIIKLITDIEADPDVNSIAFTKETGSVLIYFNEAALREQSAHARWALIFEKYNL